MAATKKVSTSKEVSLLEFWKEGWVKLSSMFIQLHYKYDWIFSHVYVGLIIKGLGNISESFWEEYHVFFLVGNVERRISGES